MANVSPSHPELRSLHSHLLSIHDSISHFQPPVKRPPILDSSLEVIQNPAEDTHWLQHDNIPGLKKLKESIKVDLDALDKFLDDPDSSNLPSLSTNAPYLIAVWNEVLCARAPVICVFKSFFVTAEDAGNNKPNQGPRTQGTKVDVVADCGRQWIRINTIKNSRILAEFREIDSYLTDDESSSDEEEEDYRPSLAQKEFDNSVLRMGRSLVAAAKMNPVHLPVSHPSFERIIPQITLCLTRLNPNTEPTDPRIAQTIQDLIDMGINVHLGERTLDEIPEVQPSTVPHPSSFIIEPTTRINLDLSVLIALVSDLTHAPLPTTIDEANSRFIPPERYLEWKRKVNATKAKAKKALDPDFHDEDFELSLPAQEDMAKTSRALTNQVLQEMEKGLLQEIADRLDVLQPNVPSDEKKPIEFWTTPEARDRCFRIVSKVGGLKEKRRVQGLLFDSSASTGEQLSEAIDTLDKAQEAYWSDSRYPQNFLSLIPLRFYPVSSAPTSSSHPLLATTSISDAPLSAVDGNPPFFRSLHTTCSDILEYEKHNRSNGDEPDNVPMSISGFARATITKASPRLTAHTVQSLAWGSALGWTTLTANRTSVKAIVKEINARARVEMFEMFMGASTTPNAAAAIWIVDPRSLAEGMRADSVDE
ncbi:uncharacterized protein C8R40DRAFT_1031760 [Lentinula edodes]|uniref:uncharacterized protein n=1 Tax=Lentinula edodes TaxID=5353 RepID=UPI001E8D2E69|nr:uncharacterized protein C8R40DRAFT_1031760 [Lentinula edodes]KAH7881658.1 hypothetical protein C8R40DRAFT_1031760 [Lentinula edodes]KAJ3921062.1 hypothetical protein F5877DRAFT_36790 [Lentinula edodes]